MISLERKINKTILNTICLILSRNMTLFLEKEEQDKCL